MKTVGGLAVIEGVMMRCENKINTSVRKNNKIISKKKILKKKNKFLKLFFIRGVVNMYEMLKIGMETLTWSADQQAEKNEKISKTEIIFSLLLSVLFAVLIFIVAPFYLTKLISQSQGMLFNIIDGVIRVIIFIIYILAISLMKDIKRVFQYHGAEHKTVHCYESGKKLTYENVKKFPTLHSRCGSSFLIIVLVISILVFSFIISPKWYYKLGFRILLIPVIIGISYEVLRLADKFKDNFFFNLLNKPGLWIQKITTKEPDKKQIEVAIYSLKKVI
jgi:uncharacterized protein YqhQ